jgi:uncharacterized membrane protein YfcA
MDPGLLLAAASALTLQQILYLGIAAFVGGIVFGVTGFAFGIVASVLLHYAFAPKDVIFVLVSGGFVLNLGSLPKYFREVQIARALPYMLGATVGMPLGLALLAVIDARLLRLGVGVLIVAYCGFALHRHRRAAIHLHGRVARTVNVGIGFVGGICGGVAGLGPLIPGVWYGLQGLGKVEQRALAQPFGLYVQGFTMVALIVSGAAGITAVASVLVITPVLLIASAIGMRALDRISLLGFQRLVLGGCLAGGTLLIARQLHWLAS